MLGPAPVLTELADLLRTAGAGPPDWPALFPLFRSWAWQAGLRQRLRWHLRQLSGDTATAVIDRSRETTTHFAWCLRDRAGEPFSFWLHEYKAQRDWRPGYANSVHNHRYHFCTTLLRGSYLQEHHRATIDPTTGLVRATELSDSGTCTTGYAGFHLADEFHRIPTAEDGTVTFLVKSRPVTPWSLSFDPTTGTGHRHVPVESRLADLPARI